MRAGFVLLLALCRLCAQVCPPARILPTDRVAGWLDDSNCQLSDATAYAPYRLDLPVRGDIRIDLATDSDFILILRNAQGVAVDSGAAIHRPLEAGGYTLLVDARVPGQVGGYSVKTAFVPEPGMMCSAFPSLGLNQTVAGVLGASGCSTPDGTPFEAYTVHTFGSGTLTVSAISPDFATALMVRDDGGHLVAWGGAQAVLAVDRDRQYQVVVSTADQAGSYQVATGFAPDAAETCRETKVLADSETDSGAITPDSCNTTIPGSGSLAYFNYYTFHVAAAGLADLSVSSRDFVPVLYLLDAGGNLLSFNSGAEIRLPLTAGDYVALVVSPAASGGGYTLASQFADGPFPRCLAAPANPGDKLAGMLTPASCWSALGPADIYSVTLPASGTFEIDPGSTAFDGILALRDSKDNLLVVSATTLSADLAAGTYTIVAAAATGSGAYQLAAAFTAHDIPPCDYVQALELDGGYIQKLRPGSCRDTDGQPMDVYEFTLPSDSVVLAVMTSSQVDGLLRLTDADGNILRTDHGSYSPNDPMIVQFLKAGKYRLQARAASGNATGYYQVDLRTTPGPRPPFCAPKGRLAPGDAIDATLSYTGCQYASTFADIYQIGLTGAATIDLRLASGEFNAYLVLLDAKGHVVAEDDDSGGGTDAEITVALPAGTYWAVAGPLSDYYHVGRYTLSLR